jgi:hypothetical protein
MRKILAHRERPVPAITRFRPDIPPGLVRVLERLLANRPEDRYATPGEVAAALLPFTQPQADKPRRRRRLLVALAALLLVGVAAAVVVHRIQTDRGESGCTSGTASGRCASSTSATKWGISEETSPRAATAVSAPPVHRSGAVPGIFKPAPCWARLKLLSKEGHRYALSSDGRDRAVADEHGRLYLFRVPAVPQTEKR